MRAGGQHAKSGVHERYVANIFTEAYYSDGDGTFRRVPLSGGWDKRVAPGDIIALRYTDSDKKEMVLDSSFPFSVECKNWKDIKHFFSGLYSKESVLFDWINQSSEDASYSGRIPIVVFKLYRQENVVAIQHTEFSKLKEMFGEFGYKAYTIDRKLIHQESQIQGFNKMVFVLLKDFVDWIDWHIYKIMDAKKRIVSLVPKK